MPKTESKPFDTRGFTSHDAVAADRARAEKSWTAGSGHQYASIGDEAGVMQPYGRAVSGKLC